MLVPIKWLKDYIDLDVSAQELADAMTLTGSNAEGVMRLAVDIEKVVVGKIIKVKQHPNADKLLICEVDVGDEVLQIVTGAPNVAPNSYVPVAVDGALLPGGIRITAGELRGEISQGMMCSASELGLAQLGYIDNGVDGILILHEEYPLGMKINDALELDDEVIDFEITSNRPDCLSMVGIAREAAVTLETSYREPEIVLDPGIGNIDDEAKVIVEDPHLCSRYCARVVKDVKIGPSPRWMRRRLAAAGIRPINNIVDITNFVMLELGQPMHAFDIDKVAQRTIVVRKAEQNERLITLDEQARDLTEDMLVIADPEKAVGIAGVMGGYNTEITPGTRNIILESAKFDGGSVRLTSKALGLRSEASSRFEKGVDIINVERAIDRAVQLIQNLDAGTVVEGKIDVCSDDLAPRIIKTQWKKINRLLGLKLDRDEICGILEALSFKAEIVGDSLKVIIPSFRQDVEGVADLAEEVARIYGYDRIPMTLMENSVALGSRTREQILTNKAKNVLAGMGLYESITYSFVSPKVYERIGFEPREHPETVIIENPLGEDQSSMRTTLIPSILEVLSRNQNRSIEVCKVFEISNIFIPKSQPMTELPIERLTLGMGQYGEDVDFYSLKGQLEALFSVFGFGDEIEFVPQLHPTFHPGRTAGVMLSGRKLGILGQVHPSVCQTYSLDDNVMLSELDFALMLEQAKTEKQFTRLPRYPAVTRDLAIIVNKKVLASSIEKLIVDSGGKILEGVELFDIYEGDQIPEGHRNLAYSLSYRAWDRTLKDTDINHIHDRIISALETKFEAQLRK